MRSLKLKDKLYGDAGDGITLKDLKKIAISLPNQPIPNPVPMNSDTRYAVLHELLIAWKLLERYTGFSWRATSYVRDSPSHSRAVSLDVAPNIAEKAWHRYAVSKLSDPVLYKRAKLIRKIQQLCRHQSPTMPVDVGFYIEPDHIHIQVFQKLHHNPQYRVIKFGIVKPCYHDSAERSQLPLIDGSGPFEPSKRR